MSSSPRSSDAPLSAADLEERFGALFGAVLSSRRSAAGISRELSARGRALQDFVLRWAAVTAKSSPELAYQFAVLARHAVAELGFAGAERWLLAAMDVHDREGLYRASAELKDLAGYIARSRERDHGVELEEVAGVLERFVAGLAGRRLGIEAGEAAWTDTATLYLPPRVALLPSRAENFRVYKVTAALLWAQTRYGTFSLPAAAYPTGPRSLALYVFLEALRLGARLERALPGLHRDLRTLASPDPGPEWAPAVQRLRRPGASAADSAALSRLLPGSAPLPTWPFLGTIDPARALAVREERLSREKHLLRTALAGLEEELGGERPSAAGSDVPRLRLQIADGTEAGHEIEVTFDGRKIVPPGALKSLAESVLQDLGRLPEDLLEARPYDAQTRPESAETVASSAGQEPGVSLYDEWDHRRGQYRRGWCTLREHDVRPGDPAFVPEVRARYRAQVWQLRRSFEALRGEDKRLRGEPYGDDVDLDALVRAHAALRAGAELDERVFVRRARQERDMAVLFMVDMSGSTKGWINDCEREALVLLTEALDVLGDRYAIYGFSGVTRKRCEIYRIKRFDEPCNALVERRIAGIQPLDYTRMGAAIRHLSRILCAQEARTRLLVTLSDGKPDDFSDGYRGEYGVEDTRQALIEAKRTGIHPFCITIDREAGAYLPHLYGAVNYVVVADVARLPLKVAEVYRRLTA